MELQKAQEIKNAESRSEALNDLYNHSLNSGMLNACTKLCLDIKSNTLSTIETTCFRDCRSTYLNTLKEFNI